MLIARKKEQRQLLEALRSDESKLVAVYGRRRVGKTYLVRETFGRQFAFQHVGYAGGSLKEQLFAFTASLRESGLESFDHPTCWLEAFELLKEVVRRSSEPKKVIFIDELSWMDTPRSDLMMALEGFWNGWASARTDIVLVLCASATSWMMNKVIHNKGGLYNRLSLQINLAPFTLGECEEYLEARGIVMSRHQILECYMVLGGVAYYWSQLQKGLSLSQNIDALFFAKNAPFKNEFDYLYSALFKRPEPYIGIIKALGTKKVGMTRKELASSLDVGNSGELSKRLNELESCGFIRAYKMFGKKSQGTIYQLIDNFTLFYLKFLRQHVSDEHFWTNNLMQAQRNAWCGLAFERVCLEHIAQIKQALGISGVLTDVCSWSCPADDDKGIFGSQIDLLIVRKDQVINLCEMKFALDEYAVTKEVDTSIRRKIHDFTTLTKTKYAVHPTLVTTFGLKENAYSPAIQAVVTADDLFGA